jgi:hypothetical protein
LNDGRPLGRRPEYRFDCIAEILSRVGRGEIGQQGLCHDFEPRCWVVEFDTGSPADQSGQQSHCWAPRTGIVTVRKAGAYNQLSPLIGSLNQYRDHRGVVLEVGVNLDYSLEPVSNRISESGPEGCSHSQVDREAHHTSPGFESHS